MPNILDYGAPTSPAQFVANRAANSVQVTFTNLLQTYLYEFDAIWNPGPLANYATADVLMAFGTYAASLFTISANTRDFLLAQKPGCIPDDHLTPPVPVTFNADGTVTLSLQSQP